MKAKFIESDDRVHVMALVHEVLYPSADFSKINMSGYLKNICQKLQKASVPSVQILFEMEDMTLNIVFAIYFGLLVNEIISNSFKLAFPVSFKAKPIIKIGLKKSETKPLIKISDNGIGIPENIKHNKTSSLGQRLIKLLFRDQLHGKLELNNKSGTAHTIVLPIRDNRDY